MAGHSQFKNIMHRKGAQDAKKAKIFAKIAREILVAAKASPDAESNPRLRAALASARAANMPNDNVQRALKKAMGGEDNATYTEIRYEGYGPGNVAVIVETLTDNVNRTASNVRTIFNKYGGSLGSTNSVTYSFKRMGQFIFPSEHSNENTEEVAIENGAEDIVTSEDGSIAVLCKVEDFHQLIQAFEAAGLKPEKQGIEWLPDIYKELDDEKAEKFVKFLDALEDDDDVQNVYHDAKEG